MSSDEDWKDQYDKAVEQRSKMRIEAIVSQFPSRRAAYNQTRSENYNEERNRLIAKGRISTPDQLRELDDFAEEFLDDFEGTEEDNRAQQIREANIRKLELNRRERIKLERTRQYLARQGKRSMNKPRTLAEINQFVRRNKKDYIF